MGGSSVANMWATIAGSPPHVSSPSVMSTMALSPSKPSRTLDAAIRESAIGVLPNACKPRIASAISGLLAASSGSDGNRGSISRQLAASSSLSTRWPNTNKPASSRLPTTLSRSSRACLATFNRVSSPSVLFILFDASRMNTTLSTALAASATMVVRQTTSNTIRFRILNLLND